MANNFLCSLSIKRKFRDIFVILCLCRKKDLEHNLAAVRRDCKFLGLGGNFPPKMPGVNIDRELVRWSCLNKLEVDDNAVGNPRSVHIGNIMPSRPLGGRRRHNYA